jgi:hypothetical protein
MSNNKFAVVDQKHPHLHGTRRLVTVSFDLILAESSPRLHTLHSKVQCLKTYLFPSDFLNACYSKSCILKLVLFRLTNPVKSPYLI